MKIFEHNAAVFIYALLTAFFFNFTVSSETFSFFPGKTPAIVPTILVLFLFLTYKKLISVLTFPKEKLFLFLGFILCAFFSGASVMGVFFYAKVHFFEFLTESFTSCIKILLLVAGGFIFFFFFLAAIGSCTQLLKNLHAPKWAVSISDFLFGTHSFIKSLLVMGICWLPHLIIRCPCALPIDSENSLYQYYGVHEYTTQHPIIYTQLLGRFSDLGEYLVNPSYGLFGLVLLQTLCLLLVLGYTLQTMKHFQAPKWLRAAALGIFSVVPIFVGYTTTLLSDAFYDAALLLLVNELAWYLFHTKHYQKHIQHPLLTMTAILGLFFRQNGFAVTAVVFLFIAAREGYLLLRRQQKVHTALLILAVFLLPLGAGKMNTSLLYEKYNPKVISKRAMFAIPLQQTANYMCKHSDDLSSEELETIQKVVTYEPEEYKEKYNPYNFDGVKHGFNNQCTTQELVGYLSTWLKLFFRHPATYIEATMHQNFCLFSPLKTNSKYYVNVREGITKITEPDFSRVYSDITAGNTMKDKLHQYYTKFCSFPILGLYENQGLMNFLLLGICLYALCKKNGRLLLVSLPLLLTLAVTFVGPAAYGHPRYTFPIHYAMPLLLGLFFTRLSKPEKNLTLTSNQEEF